MNNISNNKNLSLTNKETAPGKIISDFDILPSSFLQIASGEHIGRILFLDRPMTRLGLSDTACAVVANRGKDGYFISHLEGEVQPLVNGAPTGSNSIQLPDGVTIDIEGIQLIFYKGNNTSADNME